MVSMNFDFTCTGSRIFLDLPYQIWEMQTGDPQISTVLTRFFHNRLFFLGNDFFRCYLSYFSPDYLGRALSVFGVALFSLGLFFLVSKRRWLILTIVLAGPLFPLFEFPADSFWRGFLLWTGWSISIAIGLIGSVNLFHKK